MKILVISSGNIVQLNLYSRYFAKQGHDVTFINPAYQNPISNRSIDDEFTKNNIKFYTWAEFALKEIWKKEKFNCIFGTQHRASLEVLKYQNLIGVPTLLQILDIAEGSSLFDDPYTRLRGAEVVNVQRSFLATYGSINYLTGINPSISEQIKKLIGRNDCYYVPYPIDMDLYDSVPDQELENFIFCVSRLDTFKRVDLAIRACHSIGKKLVIASDGFLKGELECLARDLGADVEFLGVIFDLKKAELMKKCKLHIFPQTWAEAPCVPSAEAIYCKKPSIIFDYPSQRAIEGSYSYYVKPGDWQAMAEKIEWCYENYDEAIKFTIEGKEWVKENLSPDVVSQQILDILENIVI